MNVQPAAPAQVVTDEDLPPLPTPDGSGACDACGDLPAAWCPDCAACREGCYDGHVDNACTHPNASWSVTS